MKRSENFYKTYYLNQAQQKGGSLHVFHGAPYQRGYGLGSMLRGLFRWAVPKVSSAAKAAGKAALKEGVGLAQDVIEGKNLQQSAMERGKKVGKRAFDELTSQNAPQTGTGRKPIKRKNSQQKNQSAPAKKRRTSPPKTRYAIYNGTP